MTVRPANAPIAGREADDGADDDLDVILADLTLADKLCYEVLTSRHPGLDVRYVEVPGYGHLDTFIGRNAALDVFGHIVDFLDECRARV